MDTSALIARKPIEKLVAESHATRGVLSPTLGPVSITAMGIGAIIGAGIFVVTGTASAKFAGPAIVLSFLFAGVACAFVGLCYAELAAMIPVPGSTYSYTYTTLGELAAWIIGWDLVLEYAMGAATVATGWSGYVVSFLHNFGIYLPPELVAAPGVSVALANGGTGMGMINLPAILIVGALTTLLVMGTKESALVNNLMVGLKLTIVIVFIVVGASAVNVANWTPFLPANTGEFGQYGWSGVLRGASVVFYAYIGFDAVSTSAAEAKNPQRDMPIGILGSLGISTLLYVLVALVLTGLVPYTQLNVPDPIAKGIDVIGLPWLSILIKFGALVGLTTVIMVLLYGQSRILFTMSQDGLLPPVFAHVSKKYQTPYVSQWLIGGLVAFAAALTPIDVLGEMVSIGTLFAFVLVCGAVILLRIRSADAIRPFRTPNVPWVPLLGVLFCGVLMAALPAITWMRFIVWLALGLLVYFLYSRHHSKLRHDKEVDVTIVTSAK